MSRSVKHCSKFHHQQFYKKNWKQKHGNVMIPTHSILSLKNTSFSAIHFGRWKSSTFPQPHTEWPVKSAPLKVPRLDVKPRTPGDAGWSQNLWGEISGGMLCTLEVRELKKRVWSLLDSFCWQLKDVNSIRGTGVCERFDDPPPL